MIMAIEQGRNGSQPLSRGLGSNVPTRRKPQHEIMQELADGMDRQQRVLTKEIKDVSKNMKEISKLTRTDVVTAERIHDRLESLILEQRTTNLLLAKMVAMNESVLLDSNKFTINKEAEQIRNEAYYRVLHGD